MTPPPLPRVIFRPGDPRHSAPGPDVEAHKRALWRAGLIDGPASEFDQHANEKLAEAVERFQREHNLFATGNLGGPTYLKLRATPPKDDSAGGKSAYDALADKMLREAFKALHESPEQKARRLGVDAAVFWIAHKDQIAYAQARPMRLVKPPQIVSPIDCSWYVTMVYWAAGCPDPNGRGYREPVQGYTGTLVGNGERIEPWQARPMDLFFYGFTSNPKPGFPYGSPTHVALYIGGGYVGSMGSSSGPVKARSNYRPIHSVRRYALTA